MTRLEVVTCESTNAPHRASNSSSLLRAEDLPQTILPHHCQHASAKPKDNTSSQESATDTEEAMSDSAFIAFKYRTLNPHDTMGSSPHESASSAPAPGAGLADGASCLPPSQSHTLAQSDDCQEDGKLLKRQKKSLELYSMLCDTPPAIIDEIGERFHEHAILEAFRRTPHNIVLDSLNPDIAPHIVITPALDQWNSVEIMQTNTIGPQYWPYLAVPPFYGSTCRMHTYEEYMETVYRPVYETHQEHQEHNDDTCNPEYKDTLANDGETVAQPSEFQPKTTKQLSSMIDGWSAFCDSINYTLTIQARKIAAIEASLKATSFRKSYDISGFLESIGSSNEWTDPAEAILSDRSYRCPRTSYLIESNDSKVAPHIIIHLAPPNDPWVIAAHYPNQQDSDYLTLPCDKSRQHSYGYWDNDEYFSDIDGVSYVKYLSDEPSEIDTPGPQTPSCDLQRVGSGFFHSLGSELEKDITSAHQGYRDYRISNQSTGLGPADDDSEDIINAFQSSVPEQNSKFFISSYDDDWDTDSLPDIDNDEWFIQARARSSASSVSDS